MKAPQDIIIKPIITERSMDALQTGKYTFKVDRNANKIEIAEAIENVSRKFAGEGRVLIRPSGTEPLVRVMIEGKNQALIEQEAKALAELIQNVML